MARVIQAEAVYEPATEATHDVIDAETEEVIRRGVPGEWESDDGTRLTGIVRLNRPARPARWLVRYVQADGNSGTIGSGDAEPWTKERAEEKARSLLAQ